MHDGRVVVVGVQSSVFKQKHIMALLYFILSNIVYNKSTQYLLLDLRVELIHPSLICIHFVINSTQFLILTSESRVYVLVHRLQFLHAIEKMVQLCVLVIQLDYWRVKDWCLHLKFIGWDRFFLHFFLFIELFGPGEKVFDETKR